MGRDIFFINLTSIHVPDGWIDADLGCYKLLNKAVNLNWLEGKEECEKLGGYLAEPMTHRLYCLRLQSLMMSV